MIVNFACWILSFFTLGRAIPYLYLLSNKTLLNIKIVLCAWGIVTETLQILFVIVFHYEGFWIILVAVSNIFVHLMFVVPINIQTKKKHIELIDQRISCYIYLINREDGIHEIRNICAEKYGHVYTVEDIEASIVRLYKSNNTI